MCEPNQAPCEPAR